MLKSFLYVFGFLFFALKANGQTCCTAGAPISTNLEISNGEVKSLLFQLSYEYKSINLLIDQNERLVNDPRSRFGQNISLKLDYILSKKFAISAILPAVQQARSTSTQSQSSFGLGDLTVVGQYVLFANARNALNISGGVKLPTGKVNHRDALNIFLSPDMQSGSGSLDWIGRVSFNRTGFLLPLLTANLSGTCRLNGLNESFASTETFGGRSFSFGDQMNVVLAFKYLIDFKKGFIIPDLALKYRWAAPNTEQNTIAPNSGGSWLSIPVGFSYDLDGIKSIRLYGEIPIYQKLEGLQISTDFIVGLQLSYLLNKNNSDNLIEY